MHSILAKVEVPPLDLNVDMTRALRTVAANISVSPKFLPSIFGSAAQESFFQAWFNDLTVNHLPTLDSCRMYSRQPTNANAISSREMSVAGMENQRRVDSAMHGAYEDAPLRYAVEGRRWIPIEVKPLFRSNQNVSTMEMEARRQAMSYSGMTLKIAMQKFEAQHVWATSMSVNVLGVELQLLEFERDPSGTAAELRTYIGERQPLLPAGVALDVWSIRSHVEKDMGHIDYIQQRLAAAWNAERTAMCDKHLAQAANAAPAVSDARSQVSVAAQMCARCEVAPPRGLALLMQLLRAPPESKIVAPFWDCIQATVPLGPFLGAGASAAVFEHVEGGSAIKVFFDISEARFKDEKETMERLNTCIPIDEHPDCRIARLVREVEVVVASKKRHALVITPCGVPLTRLLRASRTDRIECARLAQIVNADVTRSLSIVHDQAGIAHLDIRPENIVLVMEEEEQQHAYLVDWGISLDIGKKTSFRGCEPYASRAMMDALMSCSKVSVAKSMDMESLGLTVGSIERGGLLPSEQSRQSGTV